MNGHRDDNFVESVESTLMDVKNELVFKGMVMMNKYIMSEVATCRRDAHNRLNTEKMFTEYVTKLLQVNTRDSYFYEYQISLITVMYVIHSTPHSTCNMIGFVAKLCTCCSPLQYGFSCKHMSNDA